MNGKRIICILAVFCLKGCPVFAQALAYDAMGRLTSIRYDVSQTAQIEYNMAGNISNVVFSGTQTDADTDADSMADAWELVYFNSLAQPAGGDFNQDTIDNLTHYQTLTDPTDPDTDGDSSPNADELLAGTNPTNPLSCLQLESIQTLSDGIEIQWQSVTGKHYTIQRAADLTSGQYSNILTSVLATPVMNVITDSTANGVAPGIYRIKLH